MSTFIDRDSLRWAILGTSIISGVMVDAIRASAKGEIYCIAGRTAANVDNFARKYGINVAFTDYEAALNDHNVDVVYIGLPTKLHAEFIIKCAAAGKHILCEKSLTVNAREAADAISALTNCQVFMMEAQMYRCHPVVAALKDLLLVQKPFGKTISVHANFSAPIIELFNREAGGSILDLGCYPVSLIRLLFGEFESISGTGVLVPPRAPGDNLFDSFAAADVILKNNITAHIETCNNVDHLVWSFVVRCEMGSVALSNLWDDSLKEQFIELKPNQSSLHVVDSKIYSPADRNFYTMQIDTVNEHIGRGDVQASSPAMNWEDSLGNMRFLDAWRAAIGLSYPADKILNTEMATKYS